MLSSALNLSENQYFLLLIHKSNICSSSHIMKVTEICSEMFIEIYESVRALILHTMITMRQLKVIYFDEQSVSLMSTDTLDSQIALLRDQVYLSSEEDLIYNETQRALELCEFLTDLEIDEAVRMNVEFELILCNYIKISL